MAVLPVDARIFASIYRDPNAPLVLGDNLAGDAAGVN